MTSSKYGPNKLTPSLAEQCSRVIFLDFDGVLHPPRAIAGARPPLEPHEIQAGWPATFQHLGILADLLQKHADIAVVVSSSWRIFLNDAQLGELLAPIVRWYGGSVGNPQIGRDVAIRAWLELNAITDYVVLDDKPKFFPGPAGTWPTLILCESETGISDISVQQKLRDWMNQHTASKSAAVEGALQLLGPEQQRAEPV
ncbi:HAD domain-containing protein [Comamonas thiooxydans]|uniref:HAD domain-containing protein n=1 Tax=Comamonas thiooxydans TaxID=363952 RepID=UPI001E5724C1|nr:HAD domain-containing protein [Comamonas thiooxydans]